MKKDGHTHTRFSHHGSQEPLDLYLERAIELGFTDYVVTEHAPLPDAFLAAYTGPRSQDDDSAMLASELTAYKAEVARVKEKYGNQIRIHQGFEVDYLPGYEAETKAFLQENANWIDEIVLSVHFLRNSSGLIGPIDYDTDQLKQFFPVELQNPQVLFNKYVTAVQQSIEFDTGLSTPVRIGHITLIRKFQKYFGFPDFDQENQRKITAILTSILAKGYELDVNAAGLRKEFCGESYPDAKILRQAVELQVPMTYGSDAHAVADLGLAYNELSTIINEK
ncbi:histidinol-phosphatase HisJ [Fructobacillus evanidus]|uniref:Histidinol-phosphatase n=1 Tax=Fructobacillus evanidus TaxID=3064281 RepID=A0ABN9YTW9_9LACO|nr:Histidinol phosphatase or related hydrolase of the PHP family (HIS2) [Fructobacillus sp. LMG 32999]CAK1229450.1 Histidinol phosphatase or related hydrolase of the PHP family (HIS2) [Fructobacillus sp. LMG 32999]CAK1232258.1 Histidinol phosphatase or related hydrolase of the PHP family (HIS2) [Fructobacillus sp. LMG 32999]CAK1232399.1 Histidinol phosphatase or related hydrolase of the PHP family (HIS2) [Fructobacillus sp. LMG 32999]CAK1233510.1 Histidinol phosphatase or related hydrolase of t